MESTSSCFQPGEGPSWGLLRAYEPSDGTFSSTRPHCTWCQVSSHDGQYAVFWSAGEPSSVETIKLRSSWAINLVQNGDSLKNYRQTSQINILFSICVGIKCSMKGAGIKSRFAGAGVSRTLPLRHFTFHVDTLPCLSYCHFNINFRTFKLSKWWNIFQVLLVKLA